MDQLLAGRDPSEVFGKYGLLDDLKKALSEWILNGGLDEHLEGERREGGSGNRRNASSRKTVLTGTSKMTLTIRCDRAGTFDPKLIAEYQGRFPDFDAKIISMYARGMTGREIQGHLEELYGLDMSPDLSRGAPMRCWRRPANGRTGATAQQHKGCAPGKPTDRDSKDAASTRRNLHPKPIHLPPARLDRAKHDPPLRLNPRRSNTRAFAQSGFNEVLTVKAAYPEHGPRRTL